MPALWCKKYMAKFLGIFFVLLSLCGVSLSAQSLSQIPESDREVLKLQEDTLGVLSFLIVNDSLAESRFAATRKMIPTLVKALRVHNSFYYPFDRLQAVSIQYPPDSSFRIFTWQLQVSEEEYRYYGAIQQRSSELKLFPLIDRSYEIEDPEQEILPAEKWFGALYYNILQLGSGPDASYLLFGFDANNDKVRRKLIDVLQWGGGKPSFGAPLFPPRDEAIAPRKRLMLDYSAEASVRLNYDPALELIVYDHLIEIPAADGSGMLRVPDGSYEAFKMEQQKLVYVEKLFTEIQDEAPRPEPILGTDVEKRDILGRSKKKGKGN